MRVEYPLPVVTEQPVMVPATVPLVLEVEMLAEVYADLYGDALASDVNLEVVLYGFPCQLYGRDHQR